MFLNLKFSRSNSNDQWYHWLEIRLDLIVQTGPRIRASLLQIDKITKLNIKVKFVIGKIQSRCLFTSRSLFTSSFLPVFRAEALIKINDLPLLIKINIPIKQHFGDKLYSWSMKKLVKTRYFKPIYLQIHFQSIKQCNPNVLEFHIQLYSNI